MLCKCQQTSVSESSEQPQVDLSQVKGLLDAYDPATTNLITLLQGVQKIYGYLPEEVLKEVSIVTKIKEAKIYGVATFYSQFRLKPIGKYLIMLCQGTACHVNGSANIERALQEVLAVNEGDITPDGLFTYINVACLGCCSLAPVMMINDQTHAKLTTGDVAKIINEIRAQEGMAI
ncbi:MAG: NADH-quinone oxidoreductase subunit NuoE [Clostridia bacterium]|nr:NADH-quinone oxidoreductase subunit NuoE [Clostridia bacterium]